MIAVLELLHERKGVGWAADLDIPHFDKTFRRRSRTVEGADSVMGACCFNRGSFLRIFFIGSRPNVPLGFYEALLSAPPDHCRISHISVESYSRSNTKIHIMPRSQTNTSPSTPSPLTPRPRHLAPDTLRPRHLAPSREGRRKRPDRC